MPRRTEGRVKGAVGWLREHLVVIAAVLAFGYLLLPNLVVILFSFNDPNGRFNYTWNRFSLDAWLNPCGAPGLCEALGLSLKIGLLATLGATVLGTLVAFALARHRFRGRAATNLLIFLPMATPEVVMGSSLLTLFVGLGIPLGQWTILIAHVMFCLSFVVVTVKARLAGLDPRLEQAAMDLYANELQAFLRVTLPLVFPGILAAALLAFSLSFDDYIITNFNAAPHSITFPMYVWGAASKGTPVQINVIGTLMFLLALTAVLLGQGVGRRKAR
ncbi:ABC transporter permease [Carbonactinospora thermoautotrophica]|uniref:ABC transporter permease n=1 Tax=Carbonactinospora thermoautotrophica TaxID=1469144 RepID=UPI00226F7523|nr:ABC transporter permease [Carbonactinospora thermoautotrophica]MCX9192423.1 ABC transporter permease [Carbonactinospora thermoautotrophica]